MGVRDIVISVGFEVPDWFLTGFSEVYAPLGGLIDAGEEVVRSVVAGTSVEGVFGLVDDWVAANTYPAHTDRLPLMKVSHVIAIISLYVFSIFCLYCIGDRLPNLKAMVWFKWAQISHNVFLILLSAYMCWETIRQTLIGDYGLMGNPANLGPKGWPMAKIVWVFYISKWYEYLDTVFMCLRKNWVQVSFLHCYHHFATFIMFWVMCLICPGGDGFVGIVMNSFVHVVMYSYYLYTTLGWTFPLKFYITYIQMTQFAVNMIHCVTGIVKGDTNFPNLYRYLTIAYMVQLLYLFWNFMFHAKKRMAAKNKKKTA